MEFLNPAAFYGLLALPLLLLPYFLRRKPRRYPFSSLFLFTAMGIDPRVRPLGRLRVPLIFLLQLLLLALMIFALAQPVFTSRPSRVALVMDNSASMQALEGDRTRFDLARERAADIFAELHTGAVLDMYRNAPRLERLNAAGFSPAQAARALVGLKPVDVSEAALDYGTVLSQLAREREYDRVYLITDRPGRGQSGPVRVVTVGQPRANLALTSFGVHHGSLTTTSMNASVDVANFSFADQRVKVTVRGNGTALASREVAVAAGAQASVSFEDLPFRSYYEAEIDAHDSLGLDNRRFAAAPSTRKLRILGVSPRPRDLASLRAIGGIELDVVAPGDYEKADRGGYDLEIFHFSAPAVLPRTPALFILPPDRNQLVNMGEPSANPSISGWREGHPLTRYVNFLLLRPRYARPINPRAPGESIVRGARGPLVYATSKLGVNYLVLGFDLLPYLGQANLPMSILTVNVIDWFLAFSGNLGGATGEPIAVHAAQSGDMIITPTGERIALSARATTFSGTEYQGLYQSVHGGERSLIAVNLRDLNESDLRQPAPIALGEDTAAPADKSVLMPAWPYFLLAAFALILLEWFINPRMARSKRSSRLRRSMPVT